MGDWIKWCHCGRRILTTGQMKEDLPCDTCQKEKHAQEFHKDFDIKEEGGEQK